MQLTYEVEGKSYTVDLPEEAVEALRSIAERNGLTLEQALAQAAVNEKFLEDEVASGGKVLLEKGRKVRRIEYA